MDLAALRIFKSVADYGGVNAAARRLHRVPSNVSARVKQLEAEFNVKLFVREKNRLALSADGRRLLRYADELLRLADEARTAVRSDGPDGTLRIGALESTAAARLPPLLASYHSVHSKVRLELITGTSGDLVSRLRDRDIEAAFVAEPFNDAGLDKTLAFVEELVLIAPKDSAPIRSVRDVLSRTVIAFAAGCSYRCRLEAWLRDGKLVPERVLEYQSYHAILACVAAGSGIAIIPRSVLDIAVGKKDVQVSTLPRNIARARTQLVWRPGHQSSALEAMKKFACSSAGR